MYQSGEAIGLRKPDDRAKEAQRKERIVTFIRDMVAGESAWADERIAQGIQTDKVLGAFFQSVQMHVAHPSALDSTLSSWVRGLKARIAAEETEVLRRTDPDYQDKEVFDDFALRQIAQTRAVNAFVAAKPLGLDMILKDAEAVLRFQNKEQNRFTTAQTTILIRAYTKLLESGLFS